MTRPYVTCCECGKKLYAEDDAHYGEEAYFVGGDWYCEECIEDCKQEVKRVDIV